MTIDCKRVDFNNYKNSLLDVHSTSIVDRYNNKLNIICVQLNHTLNMELEIIGEGVYICKHIEKKSVSKKELTTFIVENDSTIYTIKVIINNNMDDNKIIYIGNYTFKLLDHQCNGEGNIRLTIKKIKDNSTKKKDDHEQDGHAQGEDGCHDSEHNDSDDESHGSEHDEDAHEDGDEPLDSEHSDGDEERSTDDEDRFKLYEETRNIYK
jgi:hypothetical protein|tara:strand:- start:2449 stop:3075 length:627 start_codon:yes stop_codon:yes gene_type:complete